MKKKIDFLNALIERTDVDYGPVDLEVEGIKFKSLDLDSAKFLLELAQGCLVSAQAPTHRKRRAFSCSIDSLETIYSNYPRKMGKKKAFEKLKKQISSEDDLLEFSIAVNRYADHCKKEKIEGKFIKHFDTFVNNWHDWLEAETGNCVVEADKSSFDKWKEDFLKES